METKQKNKEIKKMWQVWAIWDAEPIQVDAVIVDGKVIGYFDSDNDDFFEERHGEHFFVSKEEACAYANLEKKNLPQRAKEVCQMLQEHYDYEKHYIHNEEKITLKDFIPLDVRRQYEEEGCKRYRKIIDALLQIVENGTFNVADNTFRMDGISHIEWGNSKAIIVTKNGIRIDVKDRDDYKMLWTIFNH